MSSSSAAFAFPSTAGAATFTFKASPYPPMTSSRFAFGTMRSLSVPTLRALRKHR
jgi:hypothetical protein